MLAHCQEAQKKNLVTEFPFRHNTSLRIENWNRYNVTILRFETAQLFPT